MAPDEWSEARELFDAALNRGPEDRDAFLDESCAGRPALRAEVASLLAAHDRAGDFLERPIVEAAPDLLLDDRLDASVIGPYVLRQEIARGGMGVVYLADDTRLSRRVALKALPPGLGRDRALRERLRHEARAAAALSDPGIATVYALEEFGDELYIAGEYVPGPTLRTLLRAGPIPPAQVVDIAAQLARALAAAHAQGVVHGDIKPENIVRTAAGVVKVLDFGIARLDSVSPSLTGGGHQPGTPAYMAPEQVRGETTDFRADLFSFGVVLYEVASGSNPFAADTPNASIARVLETDPQPLSSVVRDAPPRIDDIVQRCLNKDRKHRYSSTTELVAALESLQAEQLSTAARSATRRLTSRSPRWWWEFHQAAVSAAYVLMMYPMWRIRTWLPRPWGTAFLLATLACAAAATSVRLHLWFISRFYPSELAAQRPRARQWTVPSDVGIVAALATATAVLGVDHQAVAMLLLTVAVALAVASFVIEPSTTKATFGA